MNGALTQTKKTGETMAMNTHDAPEKITRRKLSDQVLDRLKTMIQSGDLAAGDTLPSERALMDRFGVGRPAVREALQALHTQGVITINHGERSRVNAIDAATVLTNADDMARLVLSATPASLDHLKQARRMFELGMIRDIAAKVTSQDIADLRAIVDDQRAHLGDATAFVLADIRFHERIAQMTKNPIISAVSSAMLRWVFDHHSTLLHWSGNESLTLQEHERIIDLLAARDGAGALDAMARHLDRSAQVFGTPTGSVD